MDMTSASSALGYCDGVVLRGRPEGGTSNPRALGILLRRLTLVLLVVGLAWRVTRYLLHFPIWADEAKLCLNFLERDYLGLTRGLSQYQVAPLLFLWGELTALRLLGGSMLAMRLLPFLAGTGALLLFWRLARRALPPMAATLAVGFLAVAIWPVSMGASAKPYAFDLFMAVLLLLPAVHWLGAPGRFRCLVFLTLATPFAVFSSYPAVFVGGGVSLALVPSAWRNGWKSRLLWGLFNVALLAAFLANYQFAGRGQLGSSTTTGISTNQYMQGWWADGFPPLSPLAAAKWLLLAHTGEMMAYPIGASHGRSVLTTLLGLIGAWRLWTLRRRDLLVLCAAPFALGLAASCLHRYPYGASGRLDQYLAPAICLVAGTGASVLIERVRSPQARRGWLIAVGAFFAVLGVGGVVRDAFQPYYDAEANWSREVMRDFRDEARSGAPIVVFNDPDTVDPVFRWYLELYGDRISWAGRINWDRAAASGEVFCLHYGPYWVSEPEEMPRKPVRQTVVLPPGTPVFQDPGRRAWVLADGVSDEGVPIDRAEPVVKRLFRFRLVPRPAETPSRLP
jgi:hypothetical protein